MNNINELLKPISQADLIDHFKRYLEGSIESRNIIIEHNMRLVSFICSKYYKSITEKEDIFQIGLIGLVKAVDSYDYTKNIKFSTYASKIILNEINAYLKKENKNNMELSINGQINGNEDITLEDTLEDKNFDLVTSYEEKELKLYIRKYLMTLSEVERKVIEKRFGFYSNNPMTQCEVGKLLGYSQAYILKVERKALKKIKNELIKEGYKEYNNLTLKNQ